jgi:chemotaxis protein MotA
MDISSLIFLVIGFGSILLAFVLDGGAAGALLAGTAALIVFGGTISAVGVSFPIGQLIRLPGILKSFIKPKKIDLVTLVDFFKEVSYKTRKNGLLSLESEITDENEIDPFIKKGLQLVVDGVDPQAVRSILELELESTAERHSRGAGIFETAGGYAPTMGIIGTVMGLVHVLNNLTDPSVLGPKIASAFLATLYGISSANLIWLPISARLKALDIDEFNEKRLIIEGILYIQEGVNPNTIAEKLKGFLNKKEIVKFDGLGAKKEDTKEEKE